MAVVTFGLGLFADITLSPQAFLLKNQLAVTTAPLEILISILYWGLSVVCRGSLRRQPRDAIVAVPRVSDFFGPAVWLMAMRSRSRAH